MSIRIRQFRLFVALYRIGMFDWAGDSLLGALTGRIVPFYPVDEGQV